MHGAIQTMHAERGCIRAANGSSVFSHRSALTLLESFATLEVGRRVDFKTEVGSQMARTAKTTVMLIAAPFDSVV
jgi:cold shock CspA family protein